jgi:hypothetical protein
MVATLQTLTRNDPLWKKLIFLTLVILAVYGIGSLVGFYLWFVFPVQKIHGLTYLQTPHLILYYVIINFLDIAGIVVFAYLLYYRRVQTSSPVGDGVILGCYLVAVSWLIDILIYVFVRQTLPTMHEYFLGKNQPEIGIAWLVAFVAAVVAGYLETRRRSLPARQYRLESIRYVSLLVGGSILLTVIGIVFFDIRPQA